MEQFNLTGSHKDRESEAIIRYALAKGVRSLAIASTGNAAISLAAYCLMHQLECHVFISAGVSRDRLLQIKAFRPVIHTVEGDYKDAIETCNVEAEKNGFLNCNPGARFEKIVGDSEIGKEIASELRPNSVVCPSNNGTLIYGVWLGLKEAGLQPRMIAAVAPKTNFAEGIAGTLLLEGSKLQECIGLSGGASVTVEDGEIRNAARLLMKDGFIVEGAAAAGIAALSHLDIKHETVCCVITGSGLKFPNSLRNILA